MKQNTKTGILGLIVGALVVLAVWGTINDRQQYNMAQKFISLQNCKNPSYRGAKVKYIKQFYQEHAMELGMADGTKLTLPYEQVMNILCE